MRDDDLCYMPATEALARRRQPVCAHHHARVRSAVRLPLAHVGCDARPWLDDASRRPTLTAMTAPV